MQRTMLESKIHRATVRDCDLHYAGSITVDPELLEAADIREFGPEKLENYTPRVVHLDAHNEIINIDSEVATLLGASTTAA